MLTVKDFELGRLVATAGVAGLMTDEDGVETPFSEHVKRCLKRYVNGDWGDVGAEDGKLNDAALAEGTRILAAYEHETFEKIWIITEWDRSYTTILFPREY